MNFSNNFISPVQSVITLTSLKNAKTPKNIAIFRGFSSLAESQGFEPWLRYQRKHDFQSCAFDHSANSPWSNIIAGTLRMRLPQPLCRDSIPHFSAERKVVPGFFMENITWDGSRKSG